MLTYQGYEEFHYCIRSYQATKNHGEESFATKIGDVQDTVNCSENDKGNDKYDYELEHECLPLSFLW